MLIALAAMSPGVAATYDLFIQDEPIGVEYGDRETTEEGIRYTTRSRFVHGDVRYVFRSRLELSPELVPLRYELDALADGRSENVGLRLRGTEYELWVEERGRLHDQVYPAQGTTVVLDNLVVHHYQALLERYDATGGGPRSFATLVPQPQLRAPLIVRPGEGGSGWLDGAEVLLDRLELRIGQEMIELLVDRTGREVLEITVPRQYLRIVRRGFARSEDGAGAGP